MDKETIATGLIALAVGAGGMASLSNSAIDTKSVENVQVCVDIKEPNFHDRICYSPQEWEQKRTEEVNAEKTKRYQDHKKFVEEQAQLIAPDEITP